MSPVKNILQQSLIKFPGILHLIYRHLCCCCHERSSLSFILRSSRALHRHLIEWVCVCVRACLCVRECKSQMICPFWGHFPGYSQGVPYTQRQSGRSSLWPVSASQLTSLPLAILAFTLLTAGHTGERNTKIRNITTHTFSFSKGTRQRRSPSFSVLKLIFNILLRPRKKL